MEKEKPIPQNVMRYDEIEVQEEYFVRNMMDFPALQDMNGATLLLVSRVTSWRLEGQSLVFITEGDLYEKRFFYRFLDFHAIYDLLESRRTLCVRINIETDDIIRIQMAQGFDVKQRNSEMLVSRQPKETPKIEIKEDDESIYVNTRSLLITIKKDPWNISIRNKNGDLLLNQYTSSRNTERPVMKYEQPPFGYMYDIEKKDNYACELIEIANDEHFYGLGEGFMAVDKKGQDLNLWNTNGLGCNTNRTYKNVPFLISTKGYGLFVHTGNGLNANIGQRFSKAYSLVTDDEEMDYFFINGPDITTILQGYTWLTGKAPLPPKWSYGFWISKISYGSRREVEELAIRFREEEIPCDVIHIDTNWFEHDWLCDYSFSKTRFPDPADMINKLKEQGFRITLWQMPYIENNPDHPNWVYEEGVRKGYFAVRPDGISDFPHKLIDLSNPHAVEWYKNKLLRPLLEMGVAAIKVDFGESIPTNYHFAGAEGKEMHNLYSLLYNKVVYEITKEVHGDQGIIWARSGWAGSQRYPVHWGGDPDVDYHGLAATIRAGLSIGLSGFPFWSHDIGGFNALTDPEVYVRWMQVGCFSSHIRAHGHVTREPWDFGAEAQRISKEYLQLRYRLMPYIYSQAYLSAETSIPMFRALVIEFQQDRNVYAIDDTYMFGDSFLVAPILDSTNQRDLYLPEGLWTDYWTGKLIEGGRWYNIKADLETLPLYIRENAIIPMGPVMNYIDEKALSPLILDLYPANPCQKTFILYHNDREVPISMQVTQDNIIVDFENIFGDVELRVHHIKAADIKLNDEVIESGTENGVIIVRSDLEGKLKFLFNNTLRPTILSKKCH